MNQIISTLAPLGHSIIALSYPITDEATANKPTVFIKQDIINQLKVLPEFTVMMRLKPSLSSTPTVPIGLFEITSNLNRAYGIVNTQRNYSIACKRWC